MILITVPYNFITGSIQGHHEPCHSVLFNSYPAARKVPDMQSVMA
jgi:hypothetical protein